MAGQRLYFRYFVLFLFSIMLISVLLICVRATTEAIVRKFWSDDMSEADSASKTRKTRSIQSTNNDKGDSQIKYILEWIPRYTDDNLLVLLDGRTSFFDNDCEFTNCYITNNRTYLKSVTEYDVILFTAHNAQFVKPNDLPTERSATQKFVFATTEAASFQRVQDEIFDNFFNWTWTYRLDSDIVWKHITIYDMTGAVVGPTVDMQWLEIFKPVSLELKTKLSTKTKAAAWVTTSCNAYTNAFADVIGAELKKYGHTLDLYGRCGTLKCGKYKYSDCTELITKDYFFSIALETFDVEDYVTEKLFNAINSLTIPVVFGGANYSRFLPPNSYLNIRTLGIPRMVLTMVSLMQNMTAYVEYFNWRNHYTYESNLVDKEICKLCSALNNATMMNSTQKHSNFRAWWNHRPLGRHNSSK